MRELDWLSSLYELASRDHGWHPAQRTRSRRHPLFRSRRRNRFRMVEPLESRVMLSAQSNPGAVDLSGNGQDAAIWNLALFVGASSPDLMVPFGELSSIPVAGDWDGDGVVTPGAWDPDQGKWSQRANNDPFDNTSVTFDFGPSGTIPVAGDWNGDGTTTVGWFDPSDATWHLRNSNTDGVEDIAVFTFGTASSVPVTGDWNGDGTTTTGVFDPATATWSLRNSNSTGSADIAPFVFGQPGNDPVTGDWDGDGITTIGAVDRSSFLPEWRLRNSNDAGVEDSFFPFGNAAWIPVTGDWNGPPPAIVSLTPADDAREVSISTDLQIEFDRPVQAGFGAIAIRRTADDSLVQQFFPNVGDVTINGSTVTLNPTDDLELDTTYHVTIDFGTFSNLTNEQFPGFSESAVWSFTTQATLTPPPLLLSFVRVTPGSSPTNADTLVFRAAFSEDVTGVDANDFVVSGTTASLSVSQSTPSIYDITLSGGDLAGLNGTVGLNLAASPTITNSAGTALPSTEPDTDEVYVVDNTGPVALSVERNSPATSPTNADSLVFRVTFNEAVTGVDATDFAASGTTATIDVVSQSSTVYEVTLSGGDLAALNGTVGLNLAASPTISDLSGNSLANAEPAIDQTYLVNNSAFITSIVRQTPTTVRTNADSLIFRVTFNTGVVSVDASDFAPSGTTADLSVTSASATAFDVTLSGGDLAGLNGNVGLNLAAAPTITGLDGVPLLNEEPAIDQTFTVDNAAPQAVSFTRLIPTNTSTNADAITFRVTFNESVNDVDASDFIANGTTASVSVMSVFESSTEFDVRLSGGDLPGLNGVVGLDFAASPTITDSAGNALSGIEPVTDQTYVIDNIAPQTTSIVRHLPVLNPTAADLLTFRVTFSEGVNGVASTDFTAVGTTAAVTAQFVSQSVYDVTLAGGDLPTLNGTVGLNFAAGLTITDLAGNALPNAEAAINEAFTVDNAPFAVSFTRQTPDASPTHSDALTFRVIFNEDVTNVGADDFVASGTTAVLSVTPVTPSTYDVTLTGGDLANLNGTVGLNFAVSPTISDLIGNALTGGEPAIDETFVVDNAVPVMNSIRRESPGGTASNADTLVLRVMFSEAVEGVDATDFVVSGTSAVISVAQITPSIYDVTLSGGDLADLNTEVSLKVAESPVIVDRAGNAFAGNDPAISETYVVDNVAPAAVSFARLTPAGSPTNADSLLFRVTFSENVGGVGAEDFSVSGTTATISVAAVSPSVYDVALNGGDLPNLNAIVGLNFNSPGISDPAGNSLPLEEPSIDEVFVVDNTAPVATSFERLIPADNLTDADSLTFRVTFSEAIVGVDDKDFVPVGTTAAVTVTPISDTVYDVTLSDGDLPVLSGNVSLNFATVVTIVDAAGNALAGDAPATDEAFVVDNPPFPVSIVRQSPASSPTSADTLVFRVTFNESVTGVSAADFDTSGTTASLSVTPVSGSTYDVTLSGGDLAALNRTVALNFNSPTINDLTGNALASTRPATNEVFVVDNTQPTAISFARRTPVGASTSADTLVFRVVFSETVTGVDAGDFAVSDTTAGLSVVAVSGSIYDVTLSGGDLASLNGVVGLNFATPVIADLAGNVLAGIEPATDQTFTVDNIVPASTSFVRQVPIDSPTNATKLTFRVTFSESVTGVSASDFVATGTSAGIGVIVVSGSEYDVTLSGGNLPSLNGTVGLNFVPTAAITDLAGNALPIVEPAINEVFLVDHTAPAATSFERKSPSGSFTNADVLVFRVSFSEAVTGVSSSDFAASGTTAALNVVPVSASVYEVTLSGADLASLNGSVGLDFASGVSITDLAGNTLPAAEPSIDEEFVVDNIAPGTVSFSRQTPTDDFTNADEIVFRVTFTEAVTGVDSGDFTATGTTAFINVAAVGSLTPAVFDVTLSGGDLTNLNAAVGLSFSESPTISDLAGNSLPNTEPPVDQTFVIDNIAPGIVSIVRQSPVGSPTNADTLAFRVTFTEAVTGVAANDFAVTGTTASLGIRAVSASVYDLILSGGDLARLNGTVGLNLSASPTIADLAGNILPEIEPAIDQTFVVDNTSPRATAIMRLNPGNRLTNADSLVFQVTFNEAVTGVSEGDFIVTGTSADFVVVEVNAATYEVTLSGGDLDGLNGIVGLNLFAAATVADLAGNALSIATPPIVQTYSVDNRAPGTVSFLRRIPTAGFTSADTLVFRVTFTEAASGVDASDFVATGTTAVLSVVPVSSPNSSVFDVTLSGGNLAALNGTVGLNFSGAASITDLAGNTLPGTEPAIDEAFVVDNIAPAIMSFTRQTPAVSPTNASRLVFRITFSEPVVGVSESHFTVNGTTAATSLTVVTDSIYELTLFNGDLVSLENTVGLNVAVAPTITDRAGNSLPNLEPAIDETFVVDNIAPSVTSIVRHDPVAEVTTADSLTFRVTFSEAVTGVSTSDFAATGTTAALNVVAISESIYDVTLSGGDLPTLNGTVGLNLAMPMITDLIGNPLPGNEPGIDETYLLVELRDLGDAPAPYPTAVANNGARHTPIGPTLGTNRDVELDGMPSATATGDDVDGLPDDEDGVTFGSVMVGTLNASVTVNIQNVDAGARLDAWLDFNADGNWGGPDEHIFDSVAVINGDNILTFNVPSWAQHGTTFARFRLSTAGNLSPSGVAADGEVEDYAVTILPPVESHSDFLVSNTVGTAPNPTNSVIAADVDGDGDMDLLSASFVTGSGTRIAWYENDGSRNFTQRIISTSVSGADSSVFAADLDGDGDLDVLSASPVDDQIAWYENNGSQVFTQRTISISADGASSVFVADVDGDGDLDVLSASSHDDRIAWYENDGRQNFTQHNVNVPDTNGSNLFPDGNADGANSVFAADVDSDGDLDVLSASANDNRIAWYENDGSQNFTQRIISSSVAGAGSVLAIDLDRDGDLDVVAASGSDGVVYFENDGHQSFARLTIDGAGGAAEVSVADVDGDGDLDLLSAGSRSFFLYENDGEQHFMRRTVAGFAFGASSVTTADMDGDGDLDVVGATGGVTGRITWYANDNSDFGDAPAPYPTLLSENGARHELAGPKLGQLRDPESNGTHSANADADDTTGFQNDDDSVAFFGSIHVGMTQATVAVFVQDAFEGARLDAWIDFNGDGSWGGPGEQIFNSVAVLNGDNVLTFHVPVHAVAGTTFARFRLSTAGNLTPTGPADDGEVEDVAITIRPPFSASGYFGNQFTVSSNIDLPTSVFAADLDGDGDLDVLSTSENDDRIAWYENDGTQSFTQHNVNSPDPDGPIQFSDNGNADGAQSVFVVDVDRDGDLDVLSASANDDRIAWYENDGDQNFTQHNVNSPDPDGPEAFGFGFQNGDADGAASVFAADLDGDGDVDVLSASFNDHRIAWYENDGNQNFTQRTISLVVNGANSVFAADVDRDGDLDVLSTSFLDGHIVWHMNDGGMNFADRIIGDAGFDARSVQAVDIDRDGDVDVLAASIVSGRTVLLENDGRQNFTQRTIFSSPASSVLSVVAADVDGDGDQDIVSGSSAVLTDEIIWFENDRQRNFAPQTIASSVGVAASIFAADVDSDGDMDILAATQSGNGIVWFENDNTGPEALSFVRQSPATRLTNSDTLVFRATFSEAVTGVGTEDFLVTGATANLSVAAVSDSVYDVTLSGGDLAGFIGTVGLNFAPSPTITDLAGFDLFPSPFFHPEPAVDETFLLDNTRPSVMSIVRQQPDSSPTSADTLVFRVTFSEDVTGVDAADFAATGTTASLGVASATASVYDVTLAGGDLAFVNGTVGLNLAAPTVTDPAGNTLINAEPATDELFVLTNAIDFGDAPAPYRVTLAENGARHLPLGPRLGTSRDVEVDGSHSANADADDTNGADDEDGVTFGTIAVGALDATVTVNVQNVTGSARIDAWIDFNGDGSWGGSGEHILNNVAVVSGNNVLQFDVPGWAESGVTFARFRISSVGNLASSGSAADGEVEDHAVTILPPVSASGVFAPQNIISETADRATSVFAADLDGDGDMDVLSSSFADNRIAWYENNGSQIFTTHTISNTAIGARSVIAADVDGDGDLDVLSASSNINLAVQRIAWYENTGNRNFVAHTISNAAIGAASVFAADMDGDGDLDVLSAALTDNRIAWYENNGSQVFTQRLIPNNAPGAISVFAADVDGDGDMDVLSASLSNDLIAWYENDGRQNFTPRAISSNADNARSVFATDLDGDGDLDVLSASVSDNRVAWYENDGSQLFTQHTISTASIEPVWVTAADVDGDGDIDVLSASRRDDRVAWYENDGYQNFTAHTVNSPNPGSRDSNVLAVSAADVDGDGDLDVVSASDSADRITWYDNLIPAGQPSVINLPTGSGSTVIDVSGNLIRIRQDGLILKYIPLGGAGAITINGTATGDDRLMIDFTNGCPIPAAGLSFNAGNGGNDSLTLTGGATATVSHAFSNATDGAIRLAGPIAGTIRYTGVEPIADNLAATDRFFEFLGTGELITVSNATATTLTIDSSLAAQTTFTLPRSGLTIDTAVGDDTLNVETNLNGNYRLTIRTQQQTSISFLRAIGDITPLPGVKVSADAGAVSVLGRVNVGAFGFDIDPPTTITVAQSIHSTGPVSLQANEGVSLIGPTALLVTTGAPISIDADSDRNGSGVIVQNDPGRVIASNGGQVTLTAAAFSGLTPGSIDSNGRRVLIIDTAQRLQIPAPQAASIAVDRSSAQYACLRLPVIGVARGLSEIRPVRSDNALSGTPAFDDRLWGLRSRRWTMSTDADGVTEVLIEIGPGELEPLLDDIERQAFKPGRYQFLLDGESFDIEQSESGPLPKSERDALIDFIRHMQQQREEQQECPQQGRSSKTR